MEKTIHQGKNIARFRQMLGMKQDLLASIMGDDWTQIKVSRLEAKEEIEPEILNEVAKALKIPVEAIKNFDEDATVNFISNTFTDQAVGGHTVHYNPIINPIERWVEAIDKNEKLYEALLKEKDEKIALLERLIEKKK